MASETILGISPGTRSVGVAIIRDGRLQHWQIHSFSGAWSNTKLKYILHTLNQYTNKHKARRVAIKIPDKFPTSKGYNQIIGTLNIFFKQENISVEYFTLSDLKIEYSGNMQTNMKLLIEDIVGKHPELLTEYKKEQENKNAYYHKVFEAVAVAQMTYSI